MTRRSSIAVALLIVIGALALFALMVGGCAYQGYHKAITLDENVSAAWAQVENVLQRRFDLIPNLVETVKGYAAHEEEIFTDIAKSRERYFQAGNRAGQVEAAAGVERALSRLLMLQERYPDLKAQQQFQTLMIELEGTENRISVERKRYNDAVRALNTFRRGIFGSMYCNWAGVEKAEYFEVAEEAKEAPKVKFTEDQPPALEP
jgi:LemA protein